MDFSAYSRYAELRPRISWSREMPSKKPMRSCPVMAFQKMISGKYKIRILWDLKDGALRYGEIKNGLLRGADGSAEIAPRVLSRELKALAQSGLIDRKDYGVVPPKVEYRLTRAGQSFIPVIAVIRRWGERHLGGRPAPLGRRTAAESRASMPAA
jgi:DNA-binding HxlR family transcriptional regulator